MNNEITTTLIMWSNKGILVYIDLDNLFWYIRYIKWERGN